MAYTKLFSSIVTSTIWTEDDKTRIVWITMLALADKNGEIHASIPGLARVAGVDVASCEKAIEKFMSPDAYSRTPDDEGRRIEKMDGGWALLNHSKYREMERDDDRRTKAAERKRRQREREARNKAEGKGEDVTQPVTPESRDVPQESHQISQAEAEAEAEYLSPSSKDTPPNPPEGEGTKGDIGKGECRILPAGWQRMNASQRKQTRVNANSKTMNRIGKFFGRREGTMWTVAEAVALKNIAPDPADIAALEIYYLARIDRDQDFRRRDLGTLLNNWQGELDRANAYLLDNDITPPAP